MAIHLYNTLNRAKEVFEPADPRRVTMYVCGPTVYSRPHIGNARPAVIFDVLARLLRSRYRLSYVRNITDIDDKINAAARETGVPIADISARNLDFYHQDMEALGVLPPDIEPRATDHLAGTKTSLARYQWFWPALPRSYTRASATRLRCSPS